MALNPQTGVDEELVAAFASPEAQEALTHRAAAPAPTFDPQQLEAAVQTPLPAPAPPVAAPAEVPPDPAAAVEAAMKAAAAVGPDVKTSKVVESKGMKDARAGLKALSDDKAEGVKKQTAQNVAKANAIATDETQVTADRDKFETEAAAARARLDVQKVEVVKAAKAARDKLAADYEKDFFAEKGSAAKWGAALAVGLGAFSATWNGGPNHAWNIMEKMMDQHAAREKARLLRAKEAAEAAGEDVTRIDAAIRDFETITRPGMEKTMLEKAAQRRRELLSKFGATDAQLEGDKLWRDIKEAELEREYRFESGTATRFETDNSAQNAAKRALVMGPKDAKENEKQQVAATGIVDAMNGMRKAQSETQEFSDKDRKLITRFAAMVREIPTSDPEKFAAAISKISGGYISQLSENGRKRYGLIQLAAQDLERARSGGAISPAEMATMLELGAEKGGIRHIIDRAETTLEATAPHRRASLMEHVKSVRGNAAPGAAAAPSPRDTAAVRAEAASMLRSAKDPADRKWLEWARDNPGDPKAKQIIQANR